MPILITTPRLQVAALAARDIETFVSYRREPDVARYQSWTLESDTDQAAQLLADQESGDMANPGHWLQLALRDRVTGRLLGDVAVPTLALQLGRTLSPSSQSRGPSTEALNSALHLHFDDSVAHRVTATCDTRNRDHRRPPAQTP